MKHKECKFQIKEVGEQGTFTGLAAVYGNVDLGKDMIKKGAFTKTLADKNGEVPILWQHRSSEPIGLAKLTDSKEGLRIEGELVLEDDTARKAYALMKKKVLKGLSIGYDTVSEKIEGGIRILEELKLWEVSLVTFPMNELAQVGSVKDAEEAMDLMDRLNRWLQTCCQHPDMIGKEETDKLSQLTALAEKFSPAATQQLSAPDLHALCESIKQSCA